jgi:hypothetical protein
MRESPVIRAEPAGIGRTTDADEPMSDFMCITPAAGNTTPIIHPTTMAPLPLWSAIPHFADDITAEEPLAVTSGGARTRSP